MEPQRLIRVILALVLTAAVVCPPVWAGPNEVGSLVAWGELCGEIVAREGDRITVRFRLSGTQRLFLHKWLVDSERQLTQKMLSRDRFLLTRRVQDRRKELAQGYRDYHLSLNEFGWRVSFAQPALQDLAQPTLPNYPWITGSLSEVQPATFTVVQTLAELSPIAALSEETQRRWTFLADNSWRFLTISSPNHTGLPFLISPGEKTILWFTGLPPQTLQEKFERSHATILAVAQAFFVYRTTFAPSHRKMTLGFLARAGEAFQSEMGEVVLAENRVRLNIPEQGPEVLEPLRREALITESARGLHASLALSLLESSLVEARRTVGGLAHLDGLDYQPAFTVSGGASLSRVVQGLSVEFKIELFEP